MDVVVLLLAAAMLWWLYSSRKSKASKLKHAEGHPVEEHLASLNARWDQVKAEIALHGAPVTAPRWWGDPATDAQLNRLKKHSVHLDVELTKGQCSDLISLFTAPREEDLRVLRALKEPVGGLSEFEAALKARELMKSEEAQAIFAGRPPDPEQLIFYNYFRVKKPKNLTANEASMAIEEMLAGDEKMSDAWAAVLELWEYVSDAESRDDHELKKVPRTKFIAAAQEYMAGLEEIADSDPCEFAEILIELYPELEKA